LEQTLKNLQWLNLGKSRITDDGLKDLTALKSLQWLGLDETQITDSGLKPLAEMKELEVLFMPGAKRVTKRGVAALQKALPKIRIVH
jgi:internalin A